jgi:hypothetical protein
MMTGTAAVLGALLGASALAGCSAENGGSNDAPGTAGVGTLSVALTVDGYTVNSVQIDINSEDLAPPVSRSRTLNVSDPRATVSATERGLPAGTYTVGLSANVVDNPDTQLDESTIGCVGSVDGVAVTAGVTTQVNDLVLLCTVDGGQTRVAGGITINAEVDTRSINQCPDLVSDLFVGPLETSINGVVDISTQLVDGATITWSALAGTFNAERTQYTCPATPGTYTLTGAVRRGSCRETVTQAVACHGSFTGTCDALPTSTVVRSSCGLNTICTVTQDGCDWQANCDGELFNGEGQGDQFPFVFVDSSVCTGSVVDGELVGSCTGTNGSCDYASDSDPDPVWSCAALPREITNLTTCGVTHESCEVIQEGCDFRANCGAGTTIIAGYLEGDTVVQWDTTENGINLRCTGELADDELTGSCTQRGRVATPVTCDDFSAEVPPRAGPVCEETLPAAGFVLEGCGLDGPAFAFQRGCAWALRVGETEYAGVASETNAFTFTNADGQACTASVVDGELAGSCEGSGASCEFATVEPAADPSCFLVPSNLSSSGCEAEFDCQVVQSGCDIAASCAGGSISFLGTATATGVTFPGLEDNICVAELNAAGDGLVGQCTRPDATGCNDLVLSWQ